MAVKIIIEMVRMRLRGFNEGIGALIKDLEEPKDNIELRVNIQAKPEDVISHLKLEDICRSL